MLKAPRPGSVKTRLAAAVGPDKACAIYRALVERQIQQIPPHWPASVHFAPSDPETRLAMETWLGPRFRYEPQVGDDLGARLIHAMHLEFDRGAPHLLFIGGDCPGLDGPLLQQAADAMPSQWPIGPARDGGYYLIGLPRPCADLFLNIPWSTPQTFAATRAVHDRLGLPLLLLPPLEDVDDLPSWQRALSREDGIGRRET